MLSIFVLDVQFVVVSNPRGGEVGEVWRFRLFGMRESERPARESVLSEQ